jgi:uncharacterized protein YndB with AHSA1/START domain
MNLLFDFKVDKAASTIFITREFAADLDLVWDAFTKAEILDRWVGPKPMRVQTKEMDFRVGGRWLYTMITAENVPLDRCSQAEFIEIKPKTSFTTKNSFTDENGNPFDSGITFSITSNSFKVGVGKTTVQIVKKMASLAELEKFVVGGYFEKGTAMGMENLDEYFLSLVAKNV